MLVVCCFYTCILWNFYKQNILTYISIFELLHAGLCEGYCVKNVFLEEFWTDLDYFDLTRDLISNKTEYSGIKDYNPNQQDKGIRFNHLRRLRMFGSILRLVFAGICSLQLISLFHFHSRKFRYHVTCMLENTDLLLFVNYFWDDCLAIISLTVGVDIDAFLLQLYVFA